MNSAYTSFGSCRAYVWNNNDSKRIDPTAHDDCSLRQENIAEEV